MIANSTIKYDVFLSYRSEKYTFAKLIKEKLSQQGLSVFLDKDNLGQSDYHEKLCSTIENCRNFIILLTHGSLERCNNDPEDYCRREIEIAIHSNRRTVLVAENDKLELSAENFPESIKIVSNLNAVICNSNYFEAFVNELLSRLDRSSTVLEAENEWSEMEGVTKSSAYRQWQNELLYESYYLQFGTHGINEGETQGPEFFPIVAGNRYPIICYRAANAKVPFVHSQLSAPLEFRPARELPDLNSSPNMEIPDWVHDGGLGLLRSRYFELLSYTRRVRRWNMRGFALVGLGLDANRQVTSYRARLCTYGENCLTSHVLGFALYHKYLWLLHENTINPGIYSRPDVELQKSAEHEESEVLTIPQDMNFFPLISVQGLVVYREGDEWKILVMERADKVAVASGFWQFPPAGGFEIYGTENEKKLYINQQFDMRLALIREFLEEVYGDLDMTCENQENSGSGHEGSAGFQKVSAAIDDEKFNIHFLGVVVDLVSLRSEFSFLIVIEDASLLSLSYLVNDPKGGPPRIAKWKCGSSESKRIHSLSFNKVNEIFEPDMLWNPSSIGLAKLFSAITKDENGWLRTRYPTMPTFDIMN
jgi:hypothetical protein